MEDKMKPEKHDVQLIDREIRLLEEVSNLMEEHQLHYDELKIAIVKFKELRFWLQQLQGTHEARIRKYGNENKR